MPAERKKVVTSKSGVKLRQEKKKKKEEDLVLLCLPFSVLPPQQSFFAARKHSVKFVHAVKFAASAVLPF